MNIMPILVLTYDVGFQYLHDLIDVLIVMDVQVNILGKVKAENSHDGLCIDHVSSGYQIKLGVESCHIVYKCLYLVNRI